jgi:hypothetical protein
MRLIKRFSKTASALELFNLCWRGMWSCFMTPINAGVFHILAYGSMGIAPYILNDIRFLKISKIAIAGSTGFKVEHL